MPLVKVLRNFEVADNFLRAQPGTLITGKEHFYGITEKALAYLQERSDIPFSIVNNPEKDDDLWWINKESIQGIIKAHRSVQKGEIVVIEDFNSLNDIQEALKKRKVSR